MNFSVKIRKNSHIETSSFIELMDQYANVISENPLHFEVFEDDVDRNYMIETASATRYCTISIMNTYPSASIIKIWKVSEENGIYSAEVNVRDDDMGILYAATDAEFVPRVFITPKCSTVKDNATIRNADEQDMVVKCIITLDYVINNPELFAKFKNVCKSQIDGLKGG